MIFFLFIHFCFCVLCSCISFYFYKKYKQMLADNSELAKLALLQEKRIAEVLKCTEDAKQLMHGAEFLLAQNNYLKAVLKAILSN